MHIGAIQGSRKNLKWGLMRRFVKDIPTWIKIILVEECKLLFLSISLALQNPHAMGCTVDFWVKTMVDGFILEFVVDA
jgi:hypothetical protein